MYVYPLLERVRTQKPLVHHLTNWVTIYDCANVVKIFGASPVMAHAPQEVADMAKLASALVLNIGTLTVDFIASMTLAAQTANAKGIPVVLDVCGAGATPLRDEQCAALLKKAHINIIKGNSSEIARIAGEQVQTKGVDAVAVSNDLGTLAQTVALKHNATVVITGKEDIIANAGTRYTVKNGHEMMAHVVGTGCMATSIIGTFAAVESDLAMAAAAGLCCFGIAAELAASHSAGPGSFKVQLFDEIYHLDKEKVRRMKKIA